MSPFLTASVTLTLKRGSNGSRGSVGVEASDGVRSPLLPRSDVGVS